MEMTKNNIKAEDKEDYVMKREELGRHKKEKVKNVKIKEVLSNFVKVQLNNLLFVTL